MSALDFLLPWESQPQEAIRGVPSFGGCDLDHLWALNVGGGRSVVDSAGFADGVFGAGAGGTSGNQWLLDQNGFYINYSDAGTGTANSKILNVGSAGGSGSPSNPNLFSVVALIQVATLAADTCIYGGGTPTFSFRLTTAGKLSLVKGGSGVVATSTGTLSTATQYDVGVTWDGADAKFYINGVLDSAVSGAFTGFSSSVQYGLGAITGIVGSNSTRMYRCAVFTGVLPETAFSELRLNGFFANLFAPRSIWVPVSAGGGTAALTGTVTTATEADIVAGGETIVLTLTGDTWVAAGATFDAQRANIIAGLDSAQSELLGWDNVVKALQGVGGVVRTSDTVCTITLDAQVTYSITTDETITATIPATALTGGVAIVAAPTFDVTEGAGVTFNPAWARNANTLLIGGRL